MSTVAAANSGDTSSCRFRFLRERSGRDPTMADTATTTRDRPATAGGLREPERDDAVVFDSLHRRHAVDTIGR